MTTPAMTPYLAATVAAHESTFDAARATLGMLCELAFCGDTRAEAQNVALAVASAYHLTAEDAARLAALVPHAGPEASELSSADETADVLAARWVDRRRYLRRHGPLRGAVPAKPVPIAVAVASVLSPPEPPSEPAPAAAPEPRPVAPEAPKAPEPTPAPSPAPAASPATERKTVWDQGRGQWRVIDVPVEPEPTPAPSPAPTEAPKKRGRKPKAEATPEPTPEPSAGADERAAALEAMRSARTSEALSEATDRAEKAGTTLEERADAMMSAMENFT